MNNMRTLWHTNVGSHMWRMDRPDSDIDVFEAYIVPTRDILRGISRQNSHCSQTEKIDTAKHEIGKVVEMLISGNINFVLGVISPIILNDSPELQELRDIYRANLSKNIYNSVHGMALHNYKKYFETGKDPSWKKLAQVLRLLRFGERILRYGDIRFEPVSVDEILVPRVIESKIADLERYYDDSPLPKRPDEGPYRDYLEKLRRAELVTP